MLYSVSVITLPSHAEQLEGKPEKAVVTQVAVVADNPTNAALRLGAENADKFKGVELSRARVVIQQLG